MDSGYNASLLFLHIKAHSLTLATQVVQSVYFRLNCPISSLKPFGKKKNVKEENDCGVLIH